MKLTLLLFAFCLQISAAMVGQNVSISVSDASLKDVLREINQQTGYSFLFRDDLLRKAGKITLDLKDVPIDVALEECFRSVPVDYEIVENTIRLSPRETDSGPVVVLQEQDPLRLTGTIRDNEGNPLQGVAVIVKGTTTGAGTDADGNFVLYCPADSKVLNISFLGMKSQEIAIGTRTVFNIYLEQESMGIDEVQVIAYGTTLKRLNTGTVATVKGDAIASRPVTNVLQALQGQAAGVSLTQAVGGVGSPMNIVVRGQNSISSGTDPLIIVDGAIVNSQPGGLISDLNTSSTVNSSGANFSYYGISPLNFINPNDIESIDILKDADATSIYGSRGTNGVIIITTKKAALGEMRTSFNVSAGLSSPTYITKRLNTEQYLELRNDAMAIGTMSATSVINPITPTNFNAPDLLLWDQEAYTDWGEYEIGNPAPTYNADLSITGGTKLINTLASVNYFRKYDVLIDNPYQERLTGRLQLNHASVNNKLKISLGSVFGMENQKFTNTMVGGVSSQTQTNAPNFELYNDDGTLNAPTGIISGAYFNPEPLTNMSVYSKTENVLLTANISYELIRGLNAKVLASYTSQGNEYESVFPSTASSPQLTTQFPVPEARFTTNKFTALNFEPQLTYNLSISRATISLLAGGTLLDRQIDRTSHQVRDPGSDALLYSYQSGNPTNSSSNTIYYRFNSVFARATFNWAEKYLANFSFRRDGSSRFGPENKFGNFASVGAAWIFSSEDFIRDNLSFLSYGKLRGSYGTTGNDNIPDYQYLSLLEAQTYSRYVGAVVLSPASVTNPKVRWETTSKLDFGVELGFFKNRIILNATYYKTLSNDLLNSLPLTRQTGYTSYIGNFEGKVQNTGYEFQLNTHNLGEESKLKWTTSFNLTYNENKLVAFPDLANSQYARTLEIGRAVRAPAPLSLLEMPYHFEGINPDNGLPIIKDLTGDGTVNTNDYSRNEAWIGTARPDLWGGFGNTLTYKGFSLDIFIQYSRQLMTAWNYGTSSSSPVHGGIYNPSADIMGNYWMQPGDESKYPRPYTGVTGTAAYVTPLTQQYPISTGTILHGTYFRLKNVELSYSLPVATTSKIGIDRMVVYLRGENLAFYTKQKLYKDPEAYYPTSAPLLKVIMTGVQMSF